jgi:long-subunit acyl-CoA synthetase (AMP-forming)
MINQTQMTTIAVSSDYLVKLAKLKQESDASDGMMKTLTNIIVFESKVTDEEKNACQKAGLNLYSQDEILSKGKACDSIKDKNAVINEPSPNDCSAFSYTSGTTGDPKGVKLTHKMLIGCSFAVMTRMAQT